MLVAEIAPPLLACYLALNDSRSKTTHPLVRIGHDHGLHYHEHRSSHLVALHNPNEKTDFRGQRLSMFESSE